MMISSTTLIQIKFYELKSFYIYVEYIEKDYISIPYRELR